MAKSFLDALAYPHYPHSMHETLEPPKRRLNVSLNDDDPPILERLREIYEKRAGHRISWAEVIRIAYRKQAELEQ